MFCLNYYPYKDYIREADQLKIKYNSTDPASALTDFLQEYSDKSIVIDVTDNFDEIDAQLFAGLRKKFNNFKLIIRYENENEKQLVKENDIPFFFCNLANSIDKVYGFMKYNPTDIYICEELGFSLDSIAKILHEKGILIRTFPNICQSSFPETDSLLTFFIRPDDIPIYSKYVDVFEFISDEVRQGTIFKIYKQQKWFGDINEIIPTFKGNLDGRYVLNDFAAFRINCGKRCMYKPNSCNICNHIIELSNSFKENNIVLLPQKN